jgi:hypothetical protein
MCWGFGCISTASAKQGCRSDAATAFATSVLVDGFGCRDGGTVVPARRLNGDLGGGVHLCLMDMTALGASHSPMLEVGAARRNALDRRATLASRAAG